MFKTIFYFVIPALAFSCTPPKHWQGITFAEYISVPNGKLPVVLEIVQDTYYDGEKNRMTLHQNLTNVSDPANMFTFLQSVYMDFNTGIQYVALQDGSCVPSNITSYVGNSIPPEAEVVQNSTIGTGRSTLSVTTYRYTMQGQNIFFTMENSNCVPVSYEQSGVLPTGEGLKLETQFFGIELRRADPAVFHMPAKCRS